MSIKEGTEHPRNIRFGDSRAKQVAIDTIKNPSKGLLGGPTAAEAEKVLKVKFGYTDTQIKKLKEDAPVNATGTNVAGTGDDSSTVVVKKKKKLQVKLMKRLGIKETLDRLVPDLEYTVDEITARKNQLKELALKSEGPNDKNIETWSVFRSRTGPSRGSKLRPEYPAHIVKTPSGKFKVLALKSPGSTNYKNNVTRPSGTASGYDTIDLARNHIKTLGVVVKLKEGAAVPKDKSTDQPKKYVSGLSDKDKEAHDKHLEKGSKKSDGDKSAYKQSPADKKAKTKTSVHTKKYKQMFGENDVSLDEAIKGLQKKAEKSGMPYSILKQVYNRGMAAWKGGHRPGTTPQQWAFARVNSFITKSSGTWGKADSDLAKKVRGQ